MSTSNKILPFPADEIRAHAEQLTAELGTEISRLLIFFRGHQKSTHVLDSAALRVLSIHMTLHHLTWDPNSAEEIFYDPQKMTVVNDRQPTPTEPPTPTP